MKHSYLLDAILPHPQPKREIVIDLFEVVAYHCGLSDNTTNVFLRSGFSFIADMEFRDFDLIMATLCNNIDAALVRRELALKVKLTPNYEK